MDLSNVKKFLPLGLTIGGCLGAVGIAYFSRKDTLKAREIMVDADETMSKKEEFNATWKCYIPTGIAVATTIGCTLSAYILKEKQIAALTTGVALTATLLNEYKDAIKEKLGDDGYEEIVKLVAKPHESEIVNAVPSDITTRGLVDVMYDRPEEGNQLFYDSFLHKWFRASKDAFDLGRYFLNRNYILGMEVSMKDFYDFMCVPLTKEEQRDLANIVWTFDDENAFCTWMEWIDINLVDSCTDDGEHYYILDYNICEPESMEDRNAD